MPHNSELRMRIRARMGQSEEGREVLKKEEQRQGRHHEKAVMRSVSDDPELCRAEEVNERKLVEIETDDGSRESEAERQVKKRTHDDQPDQGMDHKSGDVRGTKRKPEDEVERDDAKRQDSKIVSCLREEELTRRDDIDGQELDPETLKKARALEMLRALMYFKRRPPTIHGTLFMATIPLSELWTRLALLNKNQPEGYLWVQGRLTKKLVTTISGHNWPEEWSNV